MREINLTDYKERAESDLQQKKQRIECKLEQLNNLINTIEELKDSDDLVEGGIEIFTLDEVDYTTSVTHPIIVRGYFNSLGDANGLFTHDTTVDQEITTSEGGVHVVETRHEIGAGCQ